MHCERPSVAAEVNAQRGGGRRIPVSRYYCSA
jgi:hypothetical protein